MLPVSMTKRFFSFGNGGQIGFDRSKLNTIAKAKKLFVSETCFRFCAIDLRISFSFGDCTQKNYPKPSVKLEQSGCNLVQSVKLGVQQFFANKLVPCIDDQMEHDADSFEVTSSECRKLQDFCRIKSAAQVELYDLLSWDQCHIKHFCLLVCQHILRHFDIPIICDALWFELTYLCS